MPGRIASAWASLALAVASCGAPPAEAPAADAGVSFQERRLAVLPDHSWMSDLHFSRDGRAVFYRIETPTRESVVVGDRQGPEFDWVIGLVWSPDSRHVAYKATQGQQVFVVLDDRPGPAFDEVDWPKFSRDRGTVVYRGRNGALWHQVFGTQVGPGYDEIEGLQETADGRRRVYWARLGNKKFQVLDGVQDGAYDEYKDSEFSADGRTFAYTAFLDYKGYVVHGDKRYGPYDAVAPLALSPDGNAVAYWARQGKKELLLTSDGARALSDELTADFDVYRKDGKTLAYLARDGDRQHVQVGANRHADADRILDFSAEAYVAVDADKSYVVLDGKRGEAFDKIWRLDPGPVYVARRGVKDYVVQGTRVGEGFESGGKFGDPVFSPDRRRVAMPVKDRERERWVVDGIPGPVFQWAYTLEFSADSRSVVYTAAIGERTFLLKDGVEVARGRHISDVFFAADGTLTYREGLEDGHERLVLGGRPTQIETVWLEHSQDGKAWGYVERIQRRQREASRQRLVVGNWRGAEYAEVDWMTFSPDGRSVAAIAKRRGTSTVYENGRPGETFDAADGGGIFELGPDDRTLAYGAVKGDRRYLVAGGLKSAGFDEENGWIPVFSPDGKRVAVSVREGEGQAMVLGTWKSDVYDEVTESAFSPDGRHFAFRAVDGTQQFLVVDGKKTRIFEYVTGPDYSRDGTRWTTARVGDRDLVVADDETVEVFEELQDARLTPDARRMVMVGKRHGKVWVRVGGERYGPYDEVGTPTAGPGGTPVAWGARIGEQHFAVVEGRRGPDADEVLWAGPGVLALRVGARRFVVANGQEGERVLGLSWPAWSADGRVLAYAVEEGGAWRVVWGGRKGAAFNRIRDLQLSADGGALAYVGTQDDADHAVLGERVGEPFDAVQGLRLAPDGGTVAYSAQEGKVWIVVVGESRCGPLEMDRAPDLIYSPDSRRVAFGAHIGSELWWKVLDVRK